MIQASGIDTVITVDLHSVQIQGMYDIPLVNVSASSRFAADIYQRYDTNNVMVVSPDAGGVERARSFGKQLDVDLAVIDKRRQKANVSEVMNILGDVEGRHCILVDDMIDTGGTLCKGAAALIDHGAIRVSAYCTHPVLSGGAIDNLNNSVLSELVVADTIPLHMKAKDCDKIRIVSLAESLGETVRRAHSDESISSIYVMD
jgi:ribose-phosphate pyrophosphokinase